MLRHFIDGKTDNVYSSVARRYTSNADQKNNRELISEIYCELKNNYRNEYFYKNTLLNKLLLGVHSVNTTTALTEVAIVNYLVLINRASAAIWQRFSKPVNWMKLRLLQKLQHPTRMEKLQLSPTNYYNLDAIII